MGKSCLEAVGLVDLVKLDIFYKKGYQVHIRNLLTNILTNSVKIRLLT